MDPENEQQADSSATESTDTSAVEAPNPVDSGNEPSSALEAVNAAIDAETPPPADEPDADDAEAAPAKPAEPKPGEAVPPPASTPTPAPAVPPPPADPVNDPIAADVKGKTRERMTQLISAVKETSAERDRYLGERDEIIGMIQSTRATPEQYGQALDYLRAVNSGDPAQIRAAIMTVQSELQALATMIGEPVAGVDLLGKHSDLKTAVEAGELSAQHAQEIAAARALRSVQQVNGHRMTEQTQAEEALNRGKASLNQLELQLRADPLYAAKRQMLIPILQPVMAQLPPEQWAAAFRSAYEKLNLPAAAPTPAPAPRPASTPSHNQPLRARQPAGTSAKQASSMLDAINEGIERAGRR